MRKYTIFAIIIFLTMNLFAQAQTENSKNVWSPQNDNGIKTYRMLPTEYSSYFIKLNTRTGQIWQIKLDQKKPKQVEIPLSISSLIAKQNEADDRFKLFPTEYGSEFLLLDQMNGKIWQITMSMQPEKNKISLVNKLPLFENENSLENRFTLNPTLENRYFVLLDKINGKLWQFNWSTKPEKSEMIEIH